MALATQIWPSTSRHEPSTETNANWAQARRSRNVPSALMVKELIRYARVSLTNNVAPSGLISEPFGKDMSGMVWITSPLGLITIRLVVGGGDASSPATPTSRSV